MKNKKVKIMICDFYNKKHNSPTPWFGHYFNEYGLNHAYPSGFGPDNYCDEFEPVRVGIVSVTANQIKGIIK